MVLRLTRGGITRRGWGLRAPAAVERLSKYGGNVLKTSLSKQGESELRDARHGGRAAA
jgi:uncharacterized membrane protein